MKFSKLLTNVIFSFLLFPLALYSQYEISNIRASHHDSFWKTMSDRPISYDDVLELLEEIRPLSRLGSVAFQVLLS